MLNAQTPTVKGNPMHLYTNAEITSNTTNLGILVAQNPESIQNKLLGFIPPESISLRLMPSPTTAEVLDNPQFPNNYTFILPRNWGTIASNDIYGKNGFGTQDNLNKALKIMPNLDTIRASWLSNSSGLDAWKILWEYDGYYGVQTAEYKGLIFKRESIDNQFTKWEFANDTQMIGTMRLDYINANTGINYMGWIKVDGTVISETKYPKLVNYIRSTMTQGRGYNDVTGGVTLSNPSGLYPRFSGDQWVGFQTNPDCAGYQPSDNVDYANKSWYLKTTDKSRGLGVCLSSNATGPFYYNDTFANYADGGWGFGNVFFDSDRQTLYQNLKFSGNESRPKSKFFSLLIYAGYPA